MMKKILFILALCISFSATAQDLKQDAKRALSSAEMSHKETVASMKDIMHQAKISEQNTCENAKSRIAIAEQDVKRAKAHTQVIISERERIVAEAKEVELRAIDRAHQEIAKAKQEIEAAKTRTIKISTEQKKAVAQTKLELERAKSALN